MFRFLKKKNELPVEREYFLSMFSGVEGGLATTAAIVSGLVVSGNNEIRTVILIALISFSVQAFNGAIGRFSAEHTNDQIDKIDELEGYKKPIIDAVIQFITHVGFSALILVPFAYINNIYYGLFAMFGLTLALMFLLGVIKALVLHNKVKKNGLEMFYMAIAVIIIGSLAGLVGR